MVTITAESENGKIAVGYNTYCSDLLQLQIPQGCVNIILHFDKSELNNLIDTLQNFKGLMTSTLGSDALK
jgi:hypothetical protein